MPGLAQRSLRDGYLGQAHGVDGSDPLRSRRPRSTGEGGTQAAVGGDEYRKRPRKHGTERYEHGGSRDSRRAGCEAECPAKTGCKTSLSPHGG